MRKKKKINLKIPTEVLIEFLGISTNFIPDQKLVKKDFMNIFPSTLITRDPGFP